MSDDLRPEFSIQDPDLLKRDRLGQLPIRIMYPKTAASKGDAWAHLWGTPPVVWLPDGRTITPFFEPMPSGPDGKARHRNPYRKDHDETHWAWTVNKWEHAPAVPRKPKAPKPPRKTRYDLLTDDGWFGDGVQEPA